MRWRDEASREAATVPWESEACSECGEPWREPDFTPRRCPQCRFLYCPLHREPLEHHCVEVAWAFNGERL